MTRKSFFFFFFLLTTIPLFLFGKWACKQGCDAWNCGSHSVTMRQGFPNMLRVEGTKWKESESLVTVLSSKPILQTEDLWLCKK